MEWLLAVVLLVAIAYLLSNETLGDQPILVPRKRVCDYYASGSVFEDIPTALARGTRLLEVHVYADEQDHPIVALDPMNYAANTMSFEQVCVLLVNDAFPSEDPFILSIVPHTDKTVTLNEVAEHLLTTVRRRLITTAKNVATLPIDSLKNKLIIVSGGVQGTELEPLVNLSWTESNLRRLSYQQAAHPRDRTELIRYNRGGISLVAPDPELRTMNVKWDTPLRFGCQWNLFDRTGGGFREKPEALRSESFLPVE